MFTILIYWRVDQNSSPFIIIIINRYRLPVIIREYYIHIQLYIYIYYIYMYIIYIYISNIHEFNWRLLVHLAHHRRKKKKKKRPFVATRCLQQFCTWAMWPFRIGFRGNGDDWVCTCHHYPPLLMMLMVKSYRNIILFLIPSGYDYVAMVFRWPRNRWLTVLTNGGSFHGYVK